jgi:raffinose/stachyose/melibiose transport system substrate-binding protein
MKHLSRREFLAYGVGSLGAVAVAGTRGSSLAHSVVRVPSTAAAKYKYDVWSFDATSDIKVFQQMVAAYNKTTSSPIAFNINFLASVAPAAYPTKIQSLFSTGKPPDMFMNWGGAYARPLISAGYVKVLNSWYEKYNWTGHKLIPAAVDYITFGGKQYGVPVNLLAMPIWYNKTLFKKAGVSVPKTYAEWGRVNASLKKAGITPAVEAVIDGWDAMRLFESLLEMTAGPTLHDQLVNLTASWDNPAVVAAFNELQQWGQSGWLEKDYVGTDPTAAGLLFTSGRAAQSVQGPWEVGTLQTAGSNLDDFDMFIPVGQTGPIRMAGFARQYQIGSQVSGARLDALGDFFNWFVQPSVSRKYFYDSGTASINGWPTSVPLANKSMQLTLSHKLYLVQDQALGFQVADVFFAQQSSVLSGSTTPKAAAKAIQAAIAKSQKS